MPTIATDTFRLSNLVKKELWPEKGFCRAEVTVNESAIKTYKVGTALGKTLTGGAGVATAGGSNTGDGAMGAITVGGTAQTGTYTLVIVKAAANAGDFVLKDPEGDVVGYGTVAVAFSAGGLSFTLADGAADFVVGDSFTIAVTGTVKYKIAVQTATDGSDKVVALVLDDYTIAATTDTKVIVLAKGPAEVSKGAIVLDATYDTDAEKAVVYASLEALNINVAPTV